MLYVCPKMGHPKPRNRGRFVMTFTYTYLSLKCSKNNMFLVSPVLRYTPWLL